MSARMIRILDDATINQIAAGEVIENPASVVKELVENALDSGATEICIETKAGGHGLIKVSDDGCGMSDNDLLLAVERHATSKLSQFHDLEHLGTLGFRGEALPSIASVSRFSLHSSHENGKGALLKLDGGKIGQLQPLPRCKGTTVEVKSLFFNVPVRKKFQKNAASDTAEIHKVLTKFALCFPACGFIWVNEGKVIQECRRGEALFPRIFSLLGEEWQENTLPVEHLHENLQLNGRIGSASFHRPNRSGQYLFINSRSVISPWFAQKVLEAYGTRLQTHRYPTFVLHLHLPPQWIDVNVHPQKREVRLREEEKMAPFVFKAINQALEAKKTQYTHALPSLNPVPVFQEAITTYTPQPDPILFEEPVFSIVAKVKHYFFVEESQGVRVVDGLRAMERIIYDQLHVEPKKQEIQTLLIPIQLKKQATLLAAHLDELNKMGLSIRPFGGDTFLIDAIPSVLEPEEIPEWIDTYLEEGKIPIHIAKCLKRGSLSLGSGSSLIKKLFRCKNPDTTPSGKPIHHLLDPSHLEKLLH
jgi:DNA mismatch repair protein MutL